MDDRIRHIRHANTTYGEVEQHPALSLAIGCKMLHHFRSPVLLVSEDGICDQQCPLSINWFRIESHKQHALVNA